MFHDVQNFDYLVFEGILSYVYGTNNVETIFKNRGVAKYHGFMERFFSKPFRDENKKIMRVFQFLNSRQIDVLFLQNITDQFYIKFSNLMKDYRILRGAKGKIRDSYNLDKKSFCNSAIIIRPDSFKKAYDGKKGNLIFLGVKQDVGIKE